MTAGLQSPTISVFFCQVIKPCQTLLRDGRLLALAQYSSVAIFISIPFLKYRCLVVCFRKDSVCLLAIDEAHCSVAVNVFFVL